MKKSKLFSSILLLMSLIPLLGSFAPTASSQAITTITTMQIVTTSTALSSLAGTNYCFWEGFFAFSAVQGQQINTVLTSSSPIDFYVLNDADFGAWKNNKYPCNLSGISSPLVNQTGTTDYNVNIVAPASGQYWYLFINRSQSNAPVITIGYPTVMTVSLAAGVGGQGLGDYSTTIILIAAIVAFGLGYAIGLRRGRGAPPPPPP